MTKAELTTILSYTRLRDRSRKACELVLVEGMSQADAARTIGISREAVSEAIKSVRKAEERLKAKASG